MFLINLFKTNNECTHDKVTPDADAQYCPDCGKYIENKWYLTRCACCNIKRKTTMKQNTIMPSSRYCPNCGTEGYYIESIKTINFIDINFAVLVKEIPPYSNLNRSQIWVEKEEKPLKLLGLKI